MVTAEVSEALSAGESPGRQSPPPSQPEPTRPDERPASGVTQTGEAAGAPPEEQGGQGDAQGETRERPARARASAYDFTEVQARLDRGEPVTTDERNALGRHQQSERAKATNAARNRQQRQQAIDWFSSEMGNLPSTIRDVALSTLGQVYDPQSPYHEMLNVKLERELEQKVVAQLGAAVDVIGNLDVRDRIVSLLGNTPEVNKWADDYRYETREAHFDAFEKLIRWDEQQKLAGSTAGKKLAELQQDNDALRAELEQFKGKQLSNGSGVATGGKEAAAGNGGFTFARYQQMTAAQRRELTDEQLSAVMTDAARRRQR